MNESQYLGYKIYKKISNEAKARIYMDFVNGKNVKIKQLAFEYQLHYNTVWKIIAQIKGLETIYHPKVIVLESAV